MTRLLALSALAGLVVGVWLNLRDLLAKVPVQPDPADDVQPPDPVTWPALIAQYDPWRKYGTGDPTPQQWVNTSSTLEPLNAADRDWLDQTVRSTQAQLMGPFPWRDPFRRSTQTGPLGPTA